MCVASKHIILQFPIDSIDFYSSLFNSILYILK